MSKRAGSSWSKRPKIGLFRFGSQAIYNFIGVKSGTEVDEKTNSLKEMCLDHDNRGKRELGGKKNEFLSVNLNS